MGSLGFSSAMMGWEPQFYVSFFSRLVTLDVNTLMVTSITSRKMVANLRGKVSKKCHCSHYVYGTVVIRVAASLTVSQQNALTQKNI